MESLQILHWEANKIAQQYKEKDWTGEPERGKHQSHVEIKTHVDIRRNKLLTTKVYW